MKILDFATSDTKSALRIINAFTKNDQYRMRQILEAMPNGMGEVQRMAELHRHRPHVKIDGDVVEFWPKKGIILRVWLQGKYYLMSFDLNLMIDQTWECLSAMVAVMKALDRRDLPVKIDKGDTITIKAAVAIAALEVAQGRANCSGILWDMARDKEI